MRKTDKMGKPTKSRQLIVSKKIYEENKDKIEAGIIEWHNRWLKSFESGRYDDNLYDDMSTPWDNADAEYGELMANEGNEDDQTDFETDVIISVLKKHLTPDGGTRLLDEVERMKNEGL